MNSQLSSREEDNDLMRALAEFTPSRLAQIDEAFVLLDAGIGAIFSATMARRAALLRTNQEKIGKPKVSVCFAGDDIAESDDPGKKRANRKAANRKGADLLRSAAHRLSGARKLHKAQVATMEMFGGLAPELKELKPPPGAPSESTPGVPGSPRRKSMVRLSSSRLMVADAGSKTPSDAISPRSDQSDSAGSGSPRTPMVSHLPEDESFREWAKEHLHLSAERLKDLERSKEFKAKLEHQMLCWYALRSHDVRVPSADAHLESSGQIESLAPNWSHQGPIEALIGSRSPALLAASEALFGLGRHSDVQHRRRAFSARMHPGNQDDEGCIEDVAHAGDDAKLPNAGIPETFARELGASIGSPSADAEEMLAAQRARGGGSENLGGCSKWTAHPLPSVGQTRQGAFGISLPRPPRFVEPHQHLLSKDVSYTPEFAYFRRCERSKLMPCPAVWRPKFSGSNSGAVGGQPRFFGDTDIVAVVETALQGALKGTPFRSLDLGGNALTDKGLSHIVKLFKAMPPLPTGTGLTSLSLAGNGTLRLFSEALIGEIEQGLQAMPELRSLDLSRVPLGGKPVMRLASALAEQPVLQRLAVADCGLGRMDQRECSSLAALLSVRKLPSGGTACLREADFSFNFFGRSGFQSTADFLRGSMIEELSFLGNGGSHMLLGCQGAAKEQQMRFNPVQLFLEGLAYNTSLVKLDLSSTGMGPDSCFVLEEAVMGHQALQQLDLNDNPLGIEGVRSILRLLLYPKCRINVCHVVSPGNADPSCRLVKYRNAHPWGMYNLDLWYPHERATLRMLVHLSETSSKGGFRVGPLKHCRFDKDKPRPVLKRDSMRRDIWVVPTSGVYSFTYQLPMSSTLSKQLLMQQQKNEDGAPTNMTKSLKSLSPRRQASKGRSAKGTRGSTESTRGKHKDIDYEREYAPQPYVDWNEVTGVIRDARLTVTALRFPVIRNMFLSLTTHKERADFIHACSFDMGFNSAQVRQLATDSSVMTLETVKSLFPGVRGRGAQLLLLVSEDCVPAPLLSSVSKDLRDCLWFQEGNVTGHFHLDLAKPADHHVAQCCLLVNTWESEILRLQNRPDISQRGNFEMLRNETYNDESFVYSRDWSMPNRGVLCFDFSSARRPPTGTKSMKEAGEVVRHLRNQSTSSHVKLRALRAISVHCYLSTKQLKSWLLCFERQEDRLDLFCMMHTRVVDPVRLLGTEVLYSSQVFSDSTRELLKRKLGCLHLLNPMHPDRVEFTCNLLIYEERMVVDFLVQLTLQEPGAKVVESHAAGHTYISAAWVNSGVPADDVAFTCSYETTSVSINQPWREYLAELYCGPQFRKERKHTMPPEVHHEQSEGSVRSAPHHRISGLERRSLFLNPTDLEHFKVDANMFAST